jgi:hypothetical protein
VHARLTLGQGVVVGHGTVELLMRQAGIKALPGSRRPNPKHQTSTAGDLVKRQFASALLDRLWVTPTASGTSVRKPAHRPHGIWSGDPWKVPQPGLDPGADLLVGPLAVRLPVPPWPEHKERRQVEPEPGDRLHRLRFEPLEALPEDGALHIIFLTGGADSRLLATARRERVILAGHS